MKKILSALLLSIIFPFVVLAYPNYLIAGGESIGIKINTDGLIVIGFYKVNGEYIAKNNIKIGDVITKINGINVNNSSELSNIIDESILNNKNINIEINREGNIINTKLKIEKERGIYKTGLYIKDSVIGIGTLTYINPEDKSYGALGHEIKLNSNKNIVEIKNGNILESKVTSIDKSRNGYVGSKNATISYGETLGNISKNTDKGIFGKYTKSISNKKTYQIANFSEIEKNDAYILTVTDNNIIEKYNIRILDKYYNKKDTQKAFSFEIIDDSLLKLSGGIVQGMSGSPIIQNNKIIGAVTNVLVDNVKLGYGISIVTMLEENEK
ncbi:MAG: PDZ domain-containing protein [Bacilli bacterium]|nr:PDZ domain-containing protein [Bacilli bacterium]